ncbi:hypothetical protein [Halarchaeum sp. P4]|uniref:hypothetical protein n=1 Tax=Halarchaeum sp. P4 TaxID=3421639 RepID=UPI003EB9ED1A
MGVLSYFGSAFHVLLQSRPPFTDSLTIIAVAVVLGGAIWYLGKHLQSRVRTEIAELTRAGLLLILATAVSLILLYRWNATIDALKIAGVVQVGVDTGVRALLSVVLFVTAYTLTRVLKELLLGGTRSGDQTISEHQRRVSFYVGQISLYVAAVAGTFSLWGVQLSDLLLGAGVLGIIQSRRENPRVQSWDESPHSLQPLKPQRLSSNVVFL